MPIEDFNSIEFGICSVVDGQELIVRIPIDDSVKESLFEMHESFYETYLGMEGDAETFQPSEKYASTEKLTIQLNHENLQSLRDLYNQRNIPIADVALPELANAITYYFAIFRHRNRTKKIAIKRPSQFKGLLKKKLIHFIDDTLQVVPDDVFKLDNDFDFIIHANEIDILHPTGFMFIANIEEEILRTAAAATRQLSRAIRFIDFNYLADFVSSSKSAAKLIASIKSRDDLRRTSQAKLLDMCNSLGIRIREEDGKIVPEDDSIISFLQVLDRREYNVDLTEDAAEVYVASSRKKIR